MKTISNFFAIATLFMAGTLSAQDGMIKGTLTDESNEPVPFAVVALMEDSTIVQGMSTDVNGDFTFKHLVPGSYDLRFSSMGFKTKKVKGVLVSPNNTSYVYRSLRSSVDTIETIEVSTDSWIKPIISSTFSTVTSISIDQIEKGATPKNDIVAVITSLTPGVLATDDGKDLYVRGSRRGSTAYYVDGNRCIGSPDVPGMGIAGVEVLTGGVPAEYGDCTGGLVIITTKEYKMEMRRKQMAKTSRKEREEKNKISSTEEEE
ncbi:MAG: TonB-dependent receptor [Bacteroidota bacterium]|nr:TonB-dependent receptor [Bacteroidota bacterium]